MYCFTSDDFMFSVAMFVAAGPNINEGYVMQLVDMGFPLEACKKAVYNTRNNGIEEAMNWIMEHLDDPG